MLTRNAKLPRQAAGVVIAGLLAVFALTDARPAPAEIIVAMEPDYQVISPGTEFDITVVVADESSDISFNGFDLVIGYDPDLLTYVGRPLTSLAGSLMRLACPSSPFHLFEIAADSTHVSATYVLLCAGVSVTVPGDVYSLRFRAKQTRGLTTLAFLEGTAFYNAGILVTELTTLPATVEIDIESAVSDLPSRSELALRVAPNPFNPGTRVSFDLPQAGLVRAAVYDAQGRHIRTLVDGWHDGGAMEIRWNGTSDRGRRVPGGIYFFHLDYADQGKRVQTTQKVVLVP